MIRNVYIAGKSTFYNDLVNLAGGKNCFKNDLPVYPNLSREGILSIKPDIIIDVSPAMRSITCASLKGDWDDLSILPAVRNKEVYCIARDYATIPGPRITLLLEDIKEIVRKHEKKSSSREEIPLAGS
jgi:iron complex transport system substrate-binding protein